VKLQLYFLILVILISSVYAVNPHNPELTETYGLQINPLNLPYLYTQQEGQFKIHVFNISTGMPVTAGITCYLHLYNASRDYLAEVYTSTVAHQFNYEFLVGKNNFTNSGFYPIIFQCNNSNTGGFYSDFLEVSYNGQPFSEDKSPLIILILLPLIFASILIFGAVFMGDEHHVFKIFTFLLTPMLFFSSMHFALVTIAQLYNLPALQELIGDTIYWTGIITGVIITYFIIYFIYKAFKVAAQDKEENLEY